MFKSKSLNLFQRENQLELGFFLIISFIGGFLAIKYPYFWSDEAKCVDVFTKTPFYQFLIPGFYEQECGGTNLFMGLATIIWPVANPYLIVFTQWVVLIFIFKELITIFKCINLSRHQRLLFLVIFSLHPLTLYYISEARQYYFDIFLSLYLIRKYSSGELNSLNPVVAFFLFWFSFTALFTYVALNINTFLHREAIRFKGLALSIIGAATYTFSFRFFSAKQFEKMNNEFQYYTGAGDFSFHNILIKAETLFNLALFYKGHFIALCFMFLFILAAFRKVMMARFYLLLSFMFLSACLLGVYPYFDYHMWTTIYTPRTIIALISIEILTFVIVLDNVIEIFHSQKIKKFIYIMLIILAGGLGIYRVPYVDFQHDRLTQIVHLTEGLNIKPNDTFCTRHDGIAAKLRTNLGYNVLFSKSEEYFYNKHCDFFVILKIARDEFDSWVKRYPHKSIKSHDKFELIKRL